MTLERWEKIDRLFHAALEHEPAERPGFLARECADDATLRREIEKLLASYVQAGDFIEAPASDLAAALLAEDQTGLAAGQMVGPFRVAGVLAAGGMGEVYLAEDTRLGRRIALKLLPPQFTADAQRVRRFGQEARAASALNHPNIVTVYDIGQADSLHYIATEFVDGQTLRERMAGGPLGVGEALDVAAQVASALAAAHEAGIVHRDVKPENIMLRRDRIVKVLDFGLAKLAPRQLAAVEAGRPTRSAVKTNPGVVMGTVAYMSPEQARGKDVDHRTDIWSLGVVLYEMLTGRAPFEGETPSHVTVSIMEREPPPLARYTEVPAEAERIVTKALRKDRRERYQTASDMALDLKSLRQELEVEAHLNRASQPAADGAEASGKGAGRAAAVGGFASRTVHATPARPTSSAEYLVGQIKRHRLVAALAGVILVAALTTASYFYFFAGREQPAEAGEVIDSVAVLPFVNENGTPDADYFSEGISDHIINSLSRLPNLRVVSLNAVMRYRGRQVDPQQVGRELKVRAILIGRMTRRADSLTISTELVDVLDNRRLWGARYDRKLPDILVVQDEIAREVAEKLRLRLSGEEKEQLAKHPTSDVDAYHLYILGSYHHRKNTKEGFEKAVEYFEQAIKKDPNYALAYVGLAQTYHWMGSRGFWPPNESAQKAEWAALKAIELDDTLAEGHAFLGISKYNNFDWTGAEKEIERALELDPNSGLANDAYFHYLSSVGRAEEALRYAERGEELDSMSPGPVPYNALVAYAFFLARRYDEAIELFKKRLEKYPDDAASHSLLGETYLAKGMYEEGIAEMQKAVALDNAPERWDRHPMLAYAYAVAGRRAEALKILDEQHRLAERQYISPYNFAIIYTGLGDEDRAFAWLAKGIEQRTRLVFRLKSRPVFDPLRSDQRYAELLRRMNLEP